MRAHETHVNGPEIDRFARLDALYAQYCQGALADDESVADAPQMIEVPCELAPAVRRRFPKPSTH